MSNRSLFGPADQALSSITNFVPAVLVASTNGTREFGLISLSLLLVTLGLGAPRSVVSEVILAPGTRLSRDEMVGPLVVGLLVSFAVAVVFIGIGAPFAWSGGSGAAVLIAGIGLPAVAVQDLGRYMAFGRKTPARALVADTIWLSLLVPLLFMGPLGWEVVFLLWAAAGALSSIVMYLQFPLLELRFRVGVNWFASHRSRSARFAIEFMALGGASLLGLTLLAVFASPSELGIVRGVQLVGSPVLVLIAGLSLTLPVTIRELSDGRGVLAANRIVSSVGAGASAMAAVGLVFLPDSIGEALLGETWAPVEQQLPWLIPYVFFGAAGICTRASLRLVGGERISAVRQAMWSAPLGLVGPVAGYAVAGTGGSLFMLAVTSMVGAFVYYYSFRVKLASSVN